MPGFTPETLSVKAEFGRALPEVARFDWNGLTVQLLKGRDTLWVKVSRPGQGAIALRTVPWAGDYTLHRGQQGKTVSHWRIETAAGDWRIEVRFADVLRVRVDVTPVDDLLLAFWPRDLYPLDEKGDPTQARGWVEAAQRGVNGGLCYFCMDKPAFGAVLYIQNLTALNAFFADTQTRPDGVVGGEWPELGYQPPTAPMGNSPPVHPLKKGQTYVISDALMAFRDGCVEDEALSAAQFLDMLAQVYPYLDKPVPKRHPWRARAEKTRRHLMTVKDATLDPYGHTYVRPYLGAEYPDSMVQAAVLAALNAYEAVHGKRGILADTLAAGLGRFFDKDLGIVRRYLPNVGDDKDADAVDSWYLYHPLMNLARLAMAGDATARTLFVGSLDFVVRSARHFKYVWPVSFNIRTLSVITQARSPQGRGQTDVGGLYAYVMLQAFELTGDAVYADEARAALRAARGERFEMAYQTNLTGWGAAACAKLWYADRNDEWLNQSYVFVANVVHNCELWDSQLGHAHHYTNFFGLTCLHDAPYMAAYESFEVFAAFSEYLAVGGDNLSPAARLLVSEYCRYAPDCGWYFYPDALPEKALAEKPRNGRLDRALSFPLEDVYGDGQCAGQVGQEIYGCGGAFIFAARTVKPRRR
jgi:hypothetical protein